GELPLRHLLHRGVAGALRQGVAHPRHPARGGAQRGVLVIRDHARGGVQCAPATNHPSQTTNNNPATGSPTSPGNGATTTTGGPANPPPSNPIQQTAQTLQSLVGYLLK